MPDSSLRSHKLSNVDDTVALQARDGNHVGKFGFAMDLNAEGSIVA
jgi:hypothetical protein